MTGAGLVASWAAIRLSTSATRASARFQRASSSPGDQPVGRIGGVILTEGAVGRVARRLEITAESPADLIPLCWPASPLPSSL